MARADIEQQLDAWIKVPRAFVHLAWWRGQNYSYGRTRVQIDTILEYLDSAQISSPVNSTSLAVVLAVYSCS